VFRETNERSDHAIISVSGRQLDFISRYLSRPTCKLHLLACSGTHYALDRGFLELIIIRMARVICVCVHVHVHVHPYGVITRG